MKYMYRPHIISQSGVGLSQSCGAFAHDSSQEQTCALGTFSQAERGSDKWPHHMGICQDLLCRGCSTLIQTASLSWNKRILLMSRTKFSANSLKEEVLTYTKKMNTQIDQVLISLKFYVKSTYYNFFYTLN